MEYFYFAVLLRLDGLLERYSWVFIKVLPTFISESLPTKKGKYKPKRFFNLVLNGFCLIDTKIIT